MNDRIAPGSPARQARSVIPSMSREAGAGASARMRSAVFDIVLYRYTWDGSKSSRGRQESQPKTSAPVLFRARTSLWGHVVVTRHGHSLLVGSRAAPITLGAWGQGLQ